MNRLPIISITILLFIIFTSIFGGFIYKKDPYQLNKDTILKPPSFQNPLGTDRLGRDILARVIVGTQTSLIIGVGSGILTTLIGFIFGVSSGYFGKFDKFFVFLVDIFLTFPTLFLLLALISYLEGTVLIIILILSITGWMTTARLVRSESFKLLNRGYIKILRIGKVNNFKILFKYMLPPLLPIIATSFIFTLSGAILAESSLSFLGLGIVPPNISLGTILSNGRYIMDIAWWVTLFPGLIIFLITYSLINISDYLQNKI